MTTSVHSLFRIARGAAIALGLSVAGSASAIEFGLPARCAVGTECFVQQYPDMDPGSGVSDPFCGAATYDDHDGTDLRVLSMRDVVRGVPVIAMADGRVLRMRDGEPDRLIATDEDRAAVADRECGNGVIVEHAEGYETQYCHLRQGSIVVAPGDTVSKGDRIGEIGASGMAQFPHVHATVRKDGVEVDPATGRALAEGCLPDTEAAEPLFSPEVAALLDEGQSALLAVGLAGNVIDHEALVVDGPPPSATAESAATVGWGWFINLRGGDRIRFRIAAPGGEVFVDQTTEPVDRAKASYSAYAGKRGAPVPGKYQVTATLLRDGETVTEKTVTVRVD